METIHGIQCWRSNGKSASIMSFGLSTCYWSCTLAFIGADTKPSLWRLVELPTPPDQQLSRIMFANERAGWISAGRNTILKTIDGGKRWSVLDTKLATQTDISGLWFVDESRGWAAGTTDHRPTI